jgi:hypothetical protein
MGWTESDISWSSDRTSLFKPIAAKNSASAATHQFLSETYPNLYCGIDSFGFNKSCDPANPLVRVWSCVPWPPPPFAAPQPQPL